MNIFWICVVFSATSNRKKKLISKDVPFDSITIEDVDLSLVQSITLSDVYDFMSFLSHDRSLTATSRARKVATIRSVYKYLTTLFLHCGLRISELDGLNVTDVRGDQHRVLGIGNKERMHYLNEACQQALQDWMTERSMLTLVDQKALFVTLQNRRRISRAAVHKLVKKHLLAAGLDSSQYSAHKLRHTAATLMLQNGVDVRTLQEVLGHENLNTTQIYTHVDSDDLRTAARANPLGRVSRTKSKRQKKEV